MITLLGGFTMSAAPASIVNETFDPPTLALSGWQDGTTINISRQYVNSGAGGSTAVQMSADFLDYGAYVGTLVYQNGAMAGNDLATPQNTVLSFDVKADRPDLQNVVFGLQSWEGFEWNSFLPPGLLFNASRGIIPLGSYVPGKFKTVSVGVDDPLWIVEPYSGPVAGPFDPSGKTYQIWFQVDAGSLPALGQVAVTIDNVKVSSQNSMVGWKAASSGQVLFDPTIGYYVVENGIAEHLGNYKEIVTFKPDGTGVLEITAANGDKLFGFLYVLTPDSTEAGVIFENGTGRFQGAKGSYIGTLTWTGPTTFTGAARGRISTVGSNE
jgi:hypothetical protein